MYRTHTCGELRNTNLSQQVTLSGWVQKVRNLGAMTFIDIRDRYGITQLVVDEHSPERDRRQTGPRVRDPGDRQSGGTGFEEYENPHR